jgi:hypothetical protein
METTLHENLPDRLFIRIKEGEKFFLGALIVHDQVLCRHLHKALKRHVGKSMHEIGDLEMMSLLWRPTFRFEKVREN